MLARIGGNPWHEVSVAAPIRSRRPLSYGDSNETLTPGKATSMNRFGAIRASVGSLIVALAMIAVTGCDGATSPAAPTVTITPPATNANAFGAGSSTAGSVAAVTVSTPVAPTPVAPRPIGLASGG